MGRKSRCSVTMSPSLVAFVLMGFNATMAALDAVIVRFVSNDIHPLEIAFFRNLFSLIAFFLITRPGLKTLDSKGLWPLHGLRAALKLAALVAYFMAVTKLPIALVTAVAFTMPLFVTLGSMVLLREGARLHRLLALAAGFVGMLVILRPLASNSEAAWFLLLARP